MDKLRPKNLLNASEHLIPATEARPAIRVTSFLNLKLGRERILSKPTNRIARVLLRKFSSSD
jgi:hypothetical protein